MSVKNDTLLGQQIQKLRRQKGWTQEELSVKVNLSEKFIQFIETGKRRPSLKAVYRIANAFDVRVRELFNF